MTSSRSTHTASVLNNGEILVVGGLNAVALNSTELYDPLTGIWTVTSTLNYGRYLHTESSLTNGKILIIDGQIDNALILNTTELYQP